MFSRSSRFMALDYYYSFKAPGDTAPEALASFLTEVGEHATQLGFQKATLLTVDFLSDDEKEFSRRLALLPELVDEGLKGVSLPEKSHAYRHDATSGRCRLYPGTGVFLVVTDERGVESTFGFMKFPTEIRDESGEVAARIPWAKDWVFEQYVQTPDPRYREVVGIFRSKAFG